MDMRKIGPAPIDQKVAKQLLDLLSRDDDFRELFKNDAQAALAQVGYALAKDELSAAFCMQLKSSESLASKAQISRDRAKLEERLDGIFNFAISIELTAD